MNPAYSPKCVEEQYSELRLYRVLGRWDEKADPQVRSTLLGLQMFDGLSLRYGYAVLNLNFSEAITDGLNPLTMSQMPRVASQAISGSLTMNAHTEVCS
jgi:hypothetical protein